LFCWSWSKSNQFQNRAGDVIGDSTGQAIGHNFKAVVEYDGTLYFGFQIQPSKRTIQGELEAALSAATGAAVRIVGGGRTDAGVHASGQTISFHVEWKHPPEDLQRAMNAHLPQDIAVKEIAAVPDDFHARFSATGRRYRYSLFSGPVRQPLLERYAWRVRDELALEALQAVGALIVGEKDFGAFGEPPFGENTVRLVRRAEWQRQGLLLTWDIEATAFLRGMVRTLVSTAVWVATGKMTLAAFEELLQTRDRSRVAPPAPPSGLCLVEVIY
jgi:tRNA pseudouridine38-40 synthase